MLPNSRFPADLVTFTEEILNEKLHFFAQCKVGKWPQFYDISSDDCDFTQVSGNLKVQFMRYTPFFNKHNG